MSLAHPVVLSWSISQLLVALPLESPCSAPDRHRREVDGQYLGRELGHRRLPAPGPVATAVDEDDGNAHDSDGSEASATARSHGG